jgi:excinuclease ABC subunit C
LRKNDIAPRYPGCYLYKDKDGKIIYVGKAKNLRKRVTSYFSKKDHDPKTALLVQNIADAEFIITDSEVEALILENNLIKRHKPRYNIDLRDSKQYAYIQATAEPFKRLIISRKRSSDGTFYGPFVSAAERDYLLEYLNKAFMLRTCRILPRRACLRYHINLCTAPCIRKVAPEEYEAQVKKAEEVLKGKSEELLKELERQMRQSATSQDFERSILLREQISAIEHLTERQKMQRQKSYNEDIINYIVAADKVYLMLFNISKGIMHNRSEFIFGYHPEFFEEFLLQYYSEHDLPKELIIPEKVDESLSAFLNRKSRLTITVPFSGEKKELLELVKKNIEIAHLNSEQKLNSLMARLRLNSLPHVIECFDISHLSGTSMVGSMVQFREGIPDKSNYRRFKIRTVDGIDDFASISEVVRRRYERLSRENARFPDLIIIDGGKGQLSSALAMLRQLNLHIPLISIAKRLEEIYVPGLPYPIVLKKTDAALKFIQEIRDEAHRFAIKYNRLLRSKSLNLKARSKTAAISTQEAG